MMSEGVQLWGREGRSGRRVWPRLLSLSRLGGSWYEGTRAQALSCKDPPRLTYFYPGPPPRAPTAWDMEMT